jgi:membrane protein DedA with SNARE-associated domain
MQSRSSGPSSAIEDLLESRHPLMCRHHPMPTIPMQWVSHTVRHFLEHWGYWAILLALLGENAGLPLPGETVLMFASFLSHKASGLSLTWVILVGILAAVLGDNAGFLLGQKLGPRLIRWMKKVFHMDDADIAAAKDQVRRHGSATVFWARFIFGLRTVAGPLAGVLGMPWKRFMLFNALGAAVWVSSMALIGYAFANEFQTLLDYFEKGSWIIAAGLFTVGYLLWHRQKKHFKERQHSDKAA